MFSRRLPWDTPPNALSARVDEARARGERLLDLTESNPTRAGIAYPDEVIAALADPRALDYRPDPQGDAEARAAVAAYYARRGQAVDPDRLQLCASTSEAYAWLFQLLCDPGDRVLVPRPSYPLFDFLAALESVELAPYALGFDGHWYLDRDALARALDAAQARAILVVNPNNPTGSFLDRDEREALVTLAASRDVALIVDEVFSDFAFAPDPRRVATLVNETRGLCFSLSGLSKVVGLPQMKLGWIHVGGEAALARAALRRLELIADTFLSVATPIALAAPRWLELQPLLGGAIAERTRASLDELRRVIAGSAISLVPLAGGWYATLRLPSTRSDEAWALALCDAGVLVQPGYFYDHTGDEALIVVSLLTAPSLLAEGIRRLRALVDGD